MILTIVGDIATPLKNMEVGLDDYSQYSEKNMFQITNQIIMPTYIYLLYHYI